MAARHTQIRKYHADLKCNTNNNLIRISIIISSRIEQTDNNIIITIIIAILE